MGSGDKEESTPTGCKKKLMDLKECVQDSPSFRIQLKEREKEIVDLESRLEKVVSACDRMVSSGIGYTDASRAFSVSVKDLASHFQENEVIAGTLTRFYEIIKELQSYYSILFDQAQRSVQTSLRSFLSGELKKVKETKKVFHKVSDDLNSCSVRNATVTRNKLQECEESSVALANAQNMYSHHAIDYGYQINAISCVKGHEILSNLLSYMRAQFTFFHQGYDLLHEFDPFMRQVSTQVDLFQKEAVESIKEMDSRHSLVASHHMEDGSPDTPLLPMGNPTLAIENSGYLFKKPRGNSIFKTWSKRWFILKDNKLVYQSESKDEEYSVVAEDMRMCTVKYADDLDRRFCFEIVTPWRSCMVQANSDALRKKWVTYIEASIARALRISASNKKMEDDDDFQRRSMMVMDKGEPIQMLNGSPTGPRKSSSNYAMGFGFLSAPGNDKCADCDGENPNWASINLGIMLCIECSGIHRSLGVHISKVRSVTLDDWDSDLQKIMCQLGNARVNAIYEFEIPMHVRKPTSESTRAARETFIRLKYVQHAFVHPHPNYERTDIPVPPPTIPELLAPTRSPLNRRRSGEPSKSGSSPRSPTRRSFSPSFLRSSPRIQKGSFHTMSLRAPSSRPGSAGHSDYSTPADSAEDLRQTGEDRSLAMLAENFKKLEKSGKLKSWGSQKLGDKIRNTARRSSQRLSSFARNKFSEARVRLKPKEKVAGVREAYSDAEEDDDMATTSTPLLYSMSASTNNLSSSYSTPPPKPPRTFVTKRMSSSSLSDDENGLFKDSDDFSDILSAIKEMGVLCKSTSPSLEKLDSENGIPNGRIPENGLNLKKSESSPQLSHDKLFNSNEPAANLKGNSPILTPLNSIAEDQDSKQDSSEQSSDYLGVSNTSVNLPLTMIEAPTDMTDGERLVSSVPLRRKMMPPVSASFDSALATSVLTNSEGDIPATIKISETSVHTNNSNRYSILSTTSADFFSADSSDGSDSKLPSISVSPEVPPTTPKVYHLRAPSACSIEDECFSTPPSTPTLPGSSRSTLDREDKPATNQLEDVDHVTETLNLDQSNKEEGKSTNENGEQHHATDIMPSQSTPKSTPTKRKRSLTVSDYVPIQSSRTLLATTVHSKDDNFSTEYKQKNGDNEDISPVSLFSQQDMLEILGNEDPASGQSLAIPEEIEEEPLEEVDFEGAPCEDVSGVEVVDVSKEVVCCEGVSGVEVVVIPDTVTPDDFLLSAVAASNLPGILCALAHGGKINSTPATDKAPILLAIEAGNPVLIEYLFQNGAKLNCTDRHGRGSLHYAVLTDQSNLVVTLLKRGVKPELKDSEGKEAITYALEKENGDIVTLLRMVTFKEQAEQGSDNRQSQYLEELQSEFFRDIEVASLVDLERSRKSTASDSSSVASRES